MKTLDTRDLYARKCELESLRDDLDTARDALTDALETAGYTAAEIETVLKDESLEPVKGRKRVKGALGLLKDLESAAADFGDDEREELEELETLENEISDFMHGETMIPEGDFQEYAQDLADEMGLLENARQWPFTCIDWEQAARELKMDYTSVTWQGEDYYVRA